MKNEINRKFLKWSLILFGVIAASIVFYLSAKNIAGIISIFKHFVSVFDTIFLGLILAYIINPSIMFFQKTYSGIRKKKPLKNQTVRALSVLTAYTIIIFFLGILIWQLIPSLILNIGFFVSNFSSYLAKFTDFVGSISENIHYGHAIFEAVNKLIIEFAKYLTDWFDSNFMEIINVVFKTTDAVISFVVAFIISIYMSLSKDKITAQFKKILLAFFPRKWCDKVLNVAYIINDSFSGYMSGVFLTSIILGILCYICTAICGIEYAPLISFIVMITDIIPYFGPFIGAGIGAVLLLLAEPIDALWFLIIIFVLQQLTANFINPKIIGKSTGLDSVYVILSIIVMGGFFGIFGMIIGVPIFVILMKAVRKLIEIRIKEENNEKPSEQ